MTVIAIGPHPGDPEEGASGIDVKMELVEAHESQNRGDSLVKWVEKIALMVGETSGGIVKYAEGFVAARPRFT